MAISLVLVDDHPVIREGLRAMLETEPDFSVVGEAGSADEALDRCLVRRPDVALVDVELEEGDGIELAARLRQHCPSTRVIIFTAFDSGDRVIRAAEAGVRGYLLKGMPRDELFRAIRVVAEGQTVLPPSVVARLVGRQDQPSGLTERQREVLQHVAAGATNKEIARILGLQERTVKYHVAGIAQRLGAANRAEAVAIASRMGWVDEPAPRRD